MTQHMGLGSSSSQHAFIWKGVSSPSFQTILTPVLSSLIYCKRNFMCCLCFSRGIVWASMQARCHKCALYIYTVEMAAPNMHWYPKDSLWHFFADAVAICCVNTSKLHMHLEHNYFLYTNTFSYIVHTVMKWVAYKSPMPLQTQVLCICSAYAVGFFQVLLQ